MGRHRGDIWYLWNECLCKWTHSFFHSRRFTEHLLCARYCDSSEKGSLTEGWRLAGEGSPAWGKGEEKGAQVGAGEGEDSSALSCPTKCPAFMSWGFPAKHDFPPSPVSRRMISFSRLLLGSEAGGRAKTFSWKRWKNSVEEEGGAGDPLLASPRRAHFVFVCFPSWLIGQEVCWGHASSSAGMEKQHWTGSQRPGFEFWLYLQLNVWPWAGFFWSLGLTLLKKYGDSDLYSGVVKIKWENGYEILPTSSPKSYLSFTVIHRFYKHYLSIQSEQQSCSVAICYLTYEETEAQRSEEIWPRLHS